MLAGALASWQWHAIAGRHLIAYGVLASVGLLSAYGVIRGWLGLSASAAVRAAGQGEPTASSSPAMIILNLFSGRPRQLALSGCAPAAPPRKARREANDRLRAQLAERLFAAVERGLKAPPTPYR